MFCIFGKYDFSVHNKETTVESHLIFSRSADTAWNAAPLLDALFMLCMRGKLGCGVYAVYEGKARMWCLRCVCGES